MATGDGSAPLDRAILGVLNPAGTRVGVGFLVVPDLALTCAHVVSNAIGEVDAADVWGHSMRTFGFPIGREFGVWHSGRLLGRQAAGWIQAQLAEPTGYRIEQGFSGAPVWDDELGGVVGMVVAAESSTTPAGYLIPTETLLGGWPELRALVRPASPYRGLAPFRASDRAVF